MLKIITEFIIGYLLMFSYIWVLNSYSINKINMFSKRNIIIVLILASIPAIIHNDEYSIIISLVNFLLTIITFKLIFGKTFLETVIDSVFLLLLNFIGNVVCSLTIVHFFSIDEIRNIWYCQLLANAIVILTTIALSRIPIIKKTYIKIVSSKKLRTKTAEIIFLILIVVLLLILGYNMYKFSKSSSNVLINTIIVAILFTLFLIYWLERDHYIKLSDQYDEIFKYVKEFESWVEKEQLNRHEFKNQLAVLRIMTKEKKVKAKIDSIINDTININDEQINALHSLPSNGLKGLLYYKVAIINKNNIVLTLDISPKVKKDLNKLDENKLKVLCRLLGIYLDNAIEEAVLTKKRLLTLEIYKLKDNIEIVITNSLKTKTDINMNQKKNVTTKGKNRGKGLYFASKLISHNNWLEATTDIKDNFYIQRITILKNP